jgi:hypothetical protein
MHETCRKTIISKNLSEAFIHRHLPRETGSNNGTVRTFPAATVGETSKYDGKQIAQHRHQATIALDQGIFLNPDS